MSKTTKSLKRIAHCLLFSTRLCHIPFHDRRKTWIKKRICIRGALTTNFKLKVLTCLRAVLMITSPCQATANPRMTVCYHLAIASLFNKLKGTNKTNLSVSPQKNSWITAVITKTSDAIQVHHWGKYLPSLQLWYLKEKDGLTANPEFLRTANHQTTL